MNEENLKKISEAETENEALNLLKELLLKENNGEQNLVEIQLHLVSMKNELASIKQTQRNLEEKVDELIRFNNNPEAQTAALREHENKCPALQFYRQKSQMVDQPELFSNTLNTLYWKIIIGGGALALFIGAVTFIFELLGLI